MQQRESTLDRYVRLEQPKQQQEYVAKDHEIRITGPGKTRSYIAYATGLLAQKGCNAVELKAMGQAINKTVTIAEIIKRRVLGLHQLNQIASIAIQDTWEPIEEGLDSVSVTRHVSVISITLSTVPLDENSPGYQPPLPPEMVKTHISPVHAGLHGSEGGMPGGVAGHMGRASGMGSSMMSGPGSGIPGTVGAAGGGVGSMRGAPGSGLGSGSSLSGGVGSLDSYTAPNLQGVSSHLGLQPSLPPGQRLDSVVHFDGRDHARGRGGHHYGGSRGHMMGSA